MVYERDPPMRENKLCTTRIETRQGGRPSSLKIISQMYLDQIVRKNILDNVLTY